MIIFKYKCISLLFLSILLSAGKAKGQNKYTVNQLLGKEEKHLTGTTLKLHQDAQDAFEKMAASAKKEGILIKIVSGYRSYMRQQQIWDAKFKRFTNEGLSPQKALHKIITYSTIPGTSRHHWGTDIDIIDGKPEQPKSLLIAKNFENNGVFCKLKEWMDKNAATYGFYLVYTDNTDRTGFFYEPWHYSFAPISISLLNQYKQIDLYKLIEYSSIAGKQYVTKKFIEQYKNQNILDINPLLLLNP